MEWNKELAVSDIILLHNGMEWIFLYFLVGDRSVFVAAMFYDLSRIITII